MAPRRVPRVVVCVADGNRLKRCRTRVFGAPSTRLRFSYSARSISRPFLRGGGRGTDRFPDRRARFSTVAPCKRTPPRRRRKRARPSAAFRSRPTTSTKRRHAKTPSVRRRPRRTCRAPAKTSHDLYTRLLPLRPDRRPLRPRPSETRAPLRRRVVTRKRDRPRRRVKPKSRQNSPVNRLRTTKSLSCAKTHRSLVGLA